MVACARGLPDCITQLLQPVSDDERSRLTTYCSDFGLPASQLPQPPFCVPKTDLLDFEGEVAFLAYGPT